MKKRTIFDFKRVFSWLDNKKINYLNSKFTNYVIGYEVDGKYINIKSNVGKTRKVYNTESNRLRIEEAIIENRSLMEKSIDRYESKALERKKFLIINLCLVALSGIIVPLSFLTGKYPLFLISILAFSIITLITIISGIEIYVKSMEISELKKETGYKADEAIELPNINYNTLNKIKKYREQ